MPEKPIPQQRPGSTITRRQLVRLHTLWGLLAKREGFDSKDRDARIAWFNRNVLTLTKEIDGVEWELHSFKELSLECAARAIEAIQKLLPPEVLTRRSRSRRRSKRPGAVAIERARHAPTAAQLALIEELLGELAAAGHSVHDRASLEEWLRVGRSAPARRLATQRDADRIIPALRAMARRAKASTVKVAEAAEVHG